MLGLVSCSLHPRAAQKLSLAKRKKHHPAPAPTPRSASAFPTDFSGILQLCPPPVPPCLLRVASKAKDNPGSFGKVELVQDWVTLGGDPGLREGGGGRGAWFILQAGRGWLE